MSWNALHVDTYAQIEQYWLGNMGVGPWAWIDPAVTNLLLPNQAAATSVENSSTGFATNTGAADMGTLTSNSTATFIHRARAPRSLRWQFTVTANSFPVLGIKAPYRNWFGIPVAASTSYAFSCWARPDGIVDSSITCAVKLQWYDSTGAQIGSDVSGGDTVMTTWTQLSVIATSPSNAAYVKAVWVATGSTITTGASIYIDEIMLEQDTVVNTWAPGAGTRAVEIVSFNDPVPFNARFRKGIVLQLRELTI